MMNHLAHVFIDLHRGTPLAEKIAVPVGSVGMFVLGWLTTMMEYAPALITSIGGAFCAACMGLRYLVKAWIEWKTGKSTDEK